MSDCNWTREWDTDHWESDCGHDFNITEGTPSENRMIFCCFCSNPIVEHEEECPYD